MAKQEKTNVMRLLEQKKIPYQMHDYTSSGAIAGEDVARVLGENPDEVFKTLVTEELSNLIDSALPSSVISTKAFSLFSIFVDTFCAE